MRDGFIKVALGSPIVQVADVAYNVERVKDLVERAAKGGARLVVLPELCLTGYTCGDLFLQQSLQEAAVEGLSSVVLFSRGYDLVIVVGLPLALGSRLYNVAAVVYNGKILGVVPKSHIPNYREFYERRWFSPAPEETAEISLCRQVVPFGSRLLFCCAALRDFTFGVEICEDLWVPRSPSVDLALAGATVILNPSASDELVGKTEYRRNLVAMQSAKLVCAYLYADAGFGESSTDLVFAGHDLVCENGAVLAESYGQPGALVMTEIDVGRLALERRRMTTFDEPHGEVKVVSFALPLSDTSLTRRFSPKPFVPEDDRERSARCEQILSLQSMGLEKRLAHIQCRKVVIGLSGGLDSTLAFLVCVRAFDHLHLDRSGIYAVTMPGFGTTRRTKSNATKLAEALGTSIREVPIGMAVEQHFKDIGHDPEVTDFTYENSQARERTQILMDLSNQVGGIVVGTGDLSELALGWATYNGDHMSMYGVNASVPKTLVRLLVAHVAQGEEDPVKAILEDVIATPVSPELLPAKADGTINQVTEDIVGPYELHDFFLYYLVRWGFSPRKIWRIARATFQDSYPEEVLRKWLKNFYKRFFQQQFKRSCLPDGPKVGSVALSPRGDWRMPSDASVALWMREIDLL